MSDDAGACDVVVIGAGAGGMTAAAVAAAEGQRVLLIEKTGQVGGTTAWSGGMVWIPANSRMASVGLHDSPQAARAYLAATVPEAEGAALRETFLARGEEAIAYLEARTALRLQPVRAYPDYYSDRPGATPGGRALEPCAFDGRLLGADFARLRAPLPEFTLFGGMMVNRADIPHLRRMFRSGRSAAVAARLLARHATERVRAPRGTTLHLGNALAARLYRSVLDLGVTVMFDAAVTALATERGRVLGATIRTGNGLRHVTARRGVVLATGGFSHDAALRQAYFPSAAGAISAAAPGSAGDGVRLGLAAGGSLGTGLASTAFWVPASVFRRDDGSVGVYPHTVTDRAKPGVIAVNGGGRRFVNEALSYHELVLAMLRDGSAATSCHLICDREFLWRYGLGRVRPFTLRLRPYLATGYLTRAASIAALATALRLDPASLVRTVATYNAGARAGQDPEFGRGGTLYERHMGDPAHWPNPCVAPILRAPFYALALHPADLGTAAGLVTNAQAQVVRADGAPIPGLYACGNDMNAIMNGHYPGPGITLGPALIFGYIAGRHLAGQPAAEAGR